MQFELKRVTENDSKEFLTWCFDNEYSFYDNSIQEQKIKWINELPNNEWAFSVYNDLGELVGNCEFSDETDDEPEPFIVRGVQMKPDMTGKGLGHDFCKSILEYGKNTLGFSTINIAVAEFNVRAQKVYKTLGFEVVGDDIWNIRGEDYKFIYMKMTL